MKTAEVLSGAEASARCPSTPRRSIGAEAAERAVRDLLVALGRDPSDDHLRDTLAEWPAPSASS